ncbi:hypothetical protein [Anaerosporobacter sp.]|uniref:hypothetical protein n=1 Tax=Anaerosporobacter sp. TaxID=1872529 RepID=UPI00286F7729|nr:hypothetical protein [Anaerosporobacter sp.]
MMRKWMIASKAKLSKIREKTAPLSNHIFIVIPILLFLVFVICTYLDVSSIEEKAVLQYASQNNSYLKLFVTQFVDEDGEDTVTEETIISNIKEKFPTSSSMFLVLYQGEEIIFVRDETMTNKIVAMESQERSELQVIKKDVLSNTIDDTYEVVLKNKSKYIISVASIETGEEPFVLVLCTTENYYKKLFNMSAFEIHFMFYLFVFAVLFLLVTVYLYYQKRGILKERDTYKKQLVESRLKMEQLEGQLLQTPKYTLPYISFGYVEKRIVEEIMEELTRKQKKKSMKVTITLKEATREEISNFVVCLERNRIENCISCLWSKDTFVLLLLNRKEETADSYVKQLLICYKENFKDILNSIECSMERLESKQ